MFKNEFGSSAWSRGIGEWAGRRFWESRQFYSAYNALFSQLWVFLIVATIVFTVVSILGGHYIHRKRQFRLEQAVATEENPYLYRSAPGKERDLMIPVTIMQLDAIEA